MVLYIWFNLNLFGKFDVADNFFFSINKFINLYDDSIIFFFVTLTWEYPWYDTKLHLMVRLKFWSFEEYGVPPRHYHYSQVHFCSGSMFLGSHQWVKYIFWKLLILDKYKCETI